MTLSSFLGARRSFFVAVVSGIVLTLSTTISAKAADSDLSNSSDKVAYAIGINYGKSLKAQNLQFDPQEIQEGILDAIADKKPKYTEQQIQDATAIVGKDKSSKEASKVAYGVGYSFGETLQNNGVDLSPQKIVAGIKDGAAGTPKLTDDEIRTTLTAFAQDQQRKQQEKLKMAGDKAASEGEAFLAKNKNADGVKTLPSGLQYKVITDGKGKSPNVGSTVTTHYRGTLIDGTEFDSSYKRNQPATFPVNGVIAGWTEALQLMKEGSKWQLFIPAKLAYGMRGAPPVIPPNATLIFEVELLKVQ